MKGYAVQVQKTTTMLVGGRDTENDRALSGSVSYPAAALITNPAGGQTVYLGGPDVSTAAYPLESDSSLEVDLVGEILYAVTATTSQTVYILRRGTDDA